MEMNGEEVIQAPRAAVWAALNDPEILQQAIPGCQSVEKDGDDTFTATVKVKVGPVKATFNGLVTLSDIDAPNGYTITGEGKGGAAGFGKGAAEIRLRDVPEGTLLAYDVKASVGGKLAQIGSRLIDGTARKLATEFFTNFNNLVSDANMPREGMAVPRPELPSGPDAVMDDGNETAEEREASQLTADELAAVTPHIPSTPSPNRTGAADSAAEKADLASIWTRPAILIPLGLLAVIVIYFLVMGSGGG